MDGCIKGELYDDDRKAATVLQVSLGGSVKMFWVEGWIHGPGFWDQILEKSDESLVRLAKAFAGKGMCLVLGYE